MAKTPAQSPLLVVDPEFRDLIPPLEPAALRDLEASLVKSKGALDSILVWRGKIVDGHNRYAICTRLGLSYTVRDLDLPDRDAVKQWIFAHQISRRNLTTDQIVALAAQHEITTQRGSVRQRRIAGQLHEAGGNWLAGVIAGKMTLVVAHNSLAAKLGKRRLRRAAAEIPTPTEQLRLHRAEQSAREAASRNRALLRELTESREALATTAELAAASPTPIVRHELSSNRREATALTLLSDVHGETKVNPGDVPNGNIYNLAICELRLQRFFAAVEWQVRHALSAFEIRNLVMWLGGDFATGNLHPENVETAQLGPNSTILWIQDRIVAGIRQLLATDLFDRIVVPCSRGNHGRTTESMRAATGAEHCREWMMYQSLAQILSDDERVSVHADRSEHQFLSVYDWQLHFHHGHRIRYQGGVLGVGVPAAKAIAGWDKSMHADWHYFAHYHSHLMPTAAITMNGSVIGYDPYALSIKADPEPPTQHFELIDSKRGRAMFTPLWVSDPEAEAKLL